MNRNGQRCVHALGLLTLIAGAALADSPPTLVGEVRGTGSGPMEGVIVIARREGSPVATAVSTDDQGHFAFPGDRLRSGRYRLSIRAVGFALPEASPAPAVTVGRGVPARVDLALIRVTDPNSLAAQLTSLEWLNSFPGSEAQKDLITRNLVNCAFCHSLERIARSSHTAEEFIEVIRRMGTYETDHSSAERVQIVAPPAPREGLQWWGRDARAIADYLASVNLSSGRTAWDYELRPLPHPAGKATRAIITVFPIPRQPSVIHDLDVDSNGNVWYGNTAWDFIGRLDPRSGRFSEWPAPNFLPPAAPGVDRIRGVQDIQVDGADHVWAAVGGTGLAMFAPETGKWRSFQLPVVWKNPFLSPVRPGDVGIWATGLGAVPDGDLRHEQAFRLDLKTGELSAGIPLFDDKPSPADPAHAHPLNYCYMMDQDQAGNFLCTAPEASSIARADVVSGRATLIPVPTPHAYPRRGYRDDHDRFWFGEFYADRVGMIDLKTNRVVEYPIPEKYVSPYYARPDLRGGVWISSLGSDRLLRLDPASGEITQYLMPVEYDARKVVVDRRAKHTTVWLPNKNHSELIRVEVPD